MTCIRVCSNRCAAVDRLDRSLRCRAEIRMVEEVEEVHRELDVQLFVESPVLANREVRVVEIGTTAEAARLHAIRNRSQLIADQCESTLIDDLVRTAPGDAALTGEQRTQ